MSTQGHALGFFALPAHLPTCTHPRPKGANHVNPGQLPGLRVTPESRPGLRVTPALGFTAHLPSSLPRAPLHRYNPARKNSHDTDR